MTVFIEKDFYSCPPTTVISVGTEIVFGGQPFKSMSKLSGSFRRVGKDLEHETKNPPFPIVMKDRFV
tara:strand:- start:478 stop:678 length:201 start_codon:yes stop_codon:yes gene_type:complete